jgi:type VI secretion system protein VasD
MPAQRSLPPVPPAGGGLGRRPRQHSCNVAALSFSFALQACGGPQPAQPVPPTVVKLTITSNADANATADGQGAPTIVRVYQLASAAGFEKAEFYGLLNTDVAILGQDLVKRDEYLLAPDTTKEETLTIPDRVQAVGVFTAYREFQSRNWRVTVPVAANKTTHVTLSSSAGGLIRQP